MAVVRGSSAGDKVVVLLRSAAQDKRLSLRARGALALVMSWPVDWKTDAERIAAEAREGERAVLTALKELAHYGYLRRERIRMPNGRLTTEWVMSDDPQAIATGPHKPRAGAPRAGAPRAHVPRARSPRAENPRPLLERETEEETPPPSPAERAAAELVEELAVVVVAETSGKTAGKPSPAGVRSACRTLAADGWTPDELAAVVRANDWTGARGGAVVAYLRGLTLADRPRGAREGARKRPDWCGRCDERTRLVEEPQSGRQRRCPDCHPLASKTRRTTS